jgi:hypothetical protein
MSYKLLTALPLVLAGCAEPMPLAVPASIGLEAANLSSTSGQSPAVALFSGYEPRSVVTPGAWGDAE